jgi:hypothetical protein
MENRCYRISIKKVPEVASMPEFLNYTGPALTWCDVEKKWQTAPCKHLWPNQVTVHQNYKTGTFFFSTDHCQRVADENFVSITTTVPYYITPREGFESGMLSNRDDLKRFLEECGYREIPNPDPAYQA